MPDWTERLTEGEREFAESAELDPMKVFVGDDVLPFARTIAALRALVAAIREQAYYGFTDETIQNMTEGMSAQEMNQWWQKRILALTEVDMLERQEAK